jgi:hypothetical protein
MCTGFVFDSTRNCSLEVQNCNILSDSLESVFAEMKHRNFSLNYTVTVIPNKLT